MMEMEGKKYLLLIVAGLWLAMLGIVALLYYLMRRRNQRGERLMDEAVNESVNTEPMGKGELLVYLISIAVFLYIAISWMNKGLSPIMARMIVMPPILALFNARKRTGRSLFALVTVFALFLGAVLSFLIIGFPQKAPVLYLHESKMVTGRTRVSDLREAGFQVYVRIGEPDRVKEEEVLQSGIYSPYEEPKDVEAESEEGEGSEVPGYAKYLLVKEGKVLASMMLSTEAESFADRRLDWIAFREYGIQKIREEKYGFSIDGLDLCGQITEEVMQKKFSENLVLNREFSEGGRSYWLAYGSDNTFWDVYDCSMQTDAAGELVYLRYMYEKAE